MYMQLMFEKDTKNTYWGCSENCTYICKIMKFDPVSNCIQNNSNWLTIKHINWVLSFQRQKQKVLDVHLGNDTFGCHTIMQPKQTEKTGLCLTMNLHHKGSKVKRQEYRKEPAKGASGKQFIHKINHKLKQKQ